MTNYTIDGFWVPRLGQQAEVLSELSEDWTVQETEICRDVEKLGDLFRQAENEIGIGSVMEAPRMVQYTLRPVLRIQRSHEWTEMLEEDVSSGYNVHSV